MTKSEAITEMLKGKKVTHENFTNNEWVTIDGKMENNPLLYKYLLEDGVTCNEMEFWMYRKNDDWYTGWILWSPKK